MTNRPSADEPAAVTSDLFEAVYGDDDAVVRLLRAGAPAGSTDEDGRTALYAAAVDNEAGIVRLLLAAGADPDRACGPDDGDLPLCAAAAVWGHTQAVRALLAAGASPDRRELLGFTPMIWAVGQGRTETVEALLEYGADPDLPGPGDEPPLVLASRRGSPSAVRALLRHGAGSRAETLQQALEEARRYTGWRWPCAGWCPATTRRVSGP